ITRYMDPEIHISGFQIFFTFFLVALNGFFVSADIAMVRVRGSQIEIKAKAGSQTAKVARGIMLNLDGYLAATQLGITLASLGLGWAGESVMTAIMLKIFAAFGVVITESWVITASHITAFAFITILHIVFGELAPKSIAIQKSIKTVMAVSVPM